MSGYLIEAYGFICIGCFLYGVAEYGRGFCKRGIKNGLGVALVWPILIIMAIVLLPISLGQRAYRARRAKER